MVRIVLNIRGRTYILPVETNPPLAVWDACVRAYKAARKAQSELEDKGTFQSSEAIEFDAAAVRFFDLLLYMQLNTTFDSPEDIAFGRTLNNVN